MDTAYDIIGDIHGHALTLQALLERLGFTRGNGSYRHAERKAIFLGDFIDTGPHQRQTLEIVRAMVERGDALAVMGNHEFNAIAYATPRDGKHHLRPHNAKNRAQHQAFLQEYPFDSTAYRDVIAWFGTLPLWLELGQLRIVHACWDPQLMQRIALSYDAARLGPELLHRASTPGRWEFEAVETLLKGKEIPLPEGYYFNDRYGAPRHHIRIRWWDRQESTYRGKFLGSPEWETHIPDDEIQGDHGIDYDRQAPPVFIGHYWLTGTPRPLECNVACLDYSVARPGGQLVAYRWDGEQQLRADKFLCVPRLEA